MKIYLIRHSESHDDLINCYGGASDWDLTEGGAKKVENLDRSLKNLKFKKFL